MSDAPVAPGKAKLTSKQRWRWLYRFGKGEHSLWENIETNQISLCDYSGERPDETDDGPLYIQFDEPLELGTGFSSVARIGVVDGKGHETSVHASMNAVIKLSEEYDMKIMHKGKLYEIKPVDTP